MAAAFLVVAVVFVVCFPVLWGLVAIVFLIAKAARPVGQVARRQYFRPSMVALGLTTLIVGYLLWGALDPSMLFHPVTRYLYSHRDEPNGMVDNLIPDVFTVGEPRERVVTDLEEAGFGRWPMPEDQTGLEEEYHRWAGHAFFCGFELFVKLDFDKSGGLLTAVNQQGGVCL